MRHAARYCDGCSRYNSGLVVATCRIPSHQIALETSVNRWVAGSSPARGANIVRNFRGAGGTKSRPLLVFGYAIGAEAPVNREMTAACGSVLLEAVRSNSGRAAA